MSEHLRHCELLTSYLETLFYRNIRSIICKWALLWFGNFRQFLENMDLECLWIGKECIFLPRSALLVKRSKVSVTRRSNYSDLIPPGSPGDITFSLVALVFLSPHFDLAVPWLIFLITWFLSTPTFFIAHIFLLTPGLPGVGDVRIICPAHYLKNI